MIIRERRKHKIENKQSKKNGVNKIWKFVDDNTSTFMVILSFILCSAYTITAIIVQTKTFNELSPTLTENVFKFFGFELISLASIKVSKNVKEAIKHRSEDELSENSDNFIEDEIKG